MPPKRVLHFYSHKCLHLMLLEKNWMATTKETANATKESAAFLQP